MCPKAKIIRPRPKPKPTAMPRLWIAPGPCVQSAAIPVKPMKKKPKVPMASAARRFVISVCMRSSREDDDDSPRGEYPAVVSAQRAKRVCAGVDVAGERTAAGAAQREPPSAPPGGVAKQAPPPAGEHPPARPPP